VCSLRNWQAVDIVCTEKQEMGIMKWSPIWTGGNSE
jgi:hypothetical protein